MAFRISAASSSQSPPPPSPDTHSSSDASPHLTHLTPSTPLPMVRAPDDTDSSGSRSARGTPNRVAVELPRSQTASKGGCWTCRLRRKKCDEQRVDNSCATCIRLKIKCLGWGSKRPEWMRDKHAVEIYKADIKAQLTRAGLIRGQPRTSLTQDKSSPKIGSSSTPPYSVPTRTSRSSSTSHLDTNDFTYRYIDTSDHLQANASTSSRPSSGSDSVHDPVHRLPMASFSEPNLNHSDLQLLGLDLSNLTPPFHHSPKAISPVPSSATTDTFQFDPFSINFEYDTHVHSASLSPQVLHQQQHQTLPLPQFSQEANAATSSPIAGQDSFQGEHVLYYFEHVRRMQYIFAGNSITNITYSFVVQEPRGAVTNAVCALASLYHTRMRVAQGLEAPDPHPDRSAAKYFYDQAYFQLMNAKQLRGHYSEKDAIAALHLISFSLFSGGTTDWQGVLGIALEWLVQTGIVQDDNPKLALLNMSPAGRCAVKLTLWMDIFASISVMRAPKYLSFYRRLLVGGGGYWNSDNDLRMEGLTGVPDEVLLAIADVSSLAAWKSKEIRNGSLSVRELIRRGDDIEQQLRQHCTDAAGFFAERDQVPLHPSLPSIGVTHVHGGSSGLHTTGPFPDEEMRRVVASLFREAVLLYLHTVLSDSNPGVPEIAASVDSIIQLLQQLPPSEVDRSLVFPICMAGCLSDNASHRDMLKARLQAQDQSIGNLLQTRAIMEAVWQGRDVQGGAAVCWRDTIRERGVNILLI